MPPEQRRVILSLIAAFRANLTRLFGDSERCVSLAQRALELMPEPEPEELSIIRMFRPSTLVTAANTYLVDGDMTAATERFVAATVASVAMTFARRTALPVGLTSTAVRTCA